MCTHVIMTVLSVKYRLQYILDIHQYGVPPAGVVLGSIEVFNITILVSHISWLLQSSQYIIAETSTCSTITQDQSQYYLYII